MTNDDDANPALVVFEGYDGSGKSTLIEAVRRRLPRSSVRVVGRKNEAELRAISEVIEKQERPLTPDVELLLRIGLEMERGDVLTRAAVDHHLVCCDRGVLSLESWFDYRSVERAPFEPLLEAVRDRYRSSVMITCSADFETCWSRAAGRSDPSPKELLGKDANRTFFSQYQANVDKYERAGFDVVRIDTSRSSVTESTDEIVSVLRRRGAWPADGPARA